MPPWDSTRVKRRTGQLHDNSMVVELSVPVLGPIRQTWVMRHEGFEDGRRFCDVMDKGAFRSWHHEHLIEPIDDESCELIDTITYELPLGALGRTFGGAMVSKRLEKTFAYRHEATIAALKQSAVG